MERIKKVLPQIIVQLIALWVALPLLTTGFIPTHDGEYHLIRFYEFEKNLRAGNFFPRWASGLNSGYGVPLFNFFYPLPNYFGSFFHLLGFSLVDSFKLTMATGLILAGIFFYLWIKKWLGSWPAMTGAIFYLLAPYFLLDVYIRGSVGEVLSLAFFPAVLWLVEKKSLWTGLFLALLILSHNILSLIFIPFLISYLIFRKFSLYFILYTLYFGLGLSAYFWLPALAEAKYVIGLKMINFADHFPALFQLIIPSWGNGFSIKGIADGMAFQIGILHLLVVAAGILIILSKKFKKHKKNLIFFLVWFFLIFFLLQEFSLPFWKIIPFLSYFQYPWRLLSLLILIISVLAAIISSFTKTKILSVILVILALLFYGRYARPVKYLPRDDNYYLTNLNWTEGTATLNNSFNTKWFNPGFTLIKNTNEIQTNIAYFPGWKILINGQERPIINANGIISYQSEKGDNLVKIVFTDTPIRKIANLVSFSSLLFLITLAIFKKRVLI